MINTIILSFILFGYSYYYNMNINTEYIKYCLSRNE